MEAGTQTNRLDTLPDMLYPLDKKSRAYTLFQKVQGAMNNVPNFGETCKAILNAVIDEMDAVHRRVESAFAQPGDREIEFTVIHRACPSVQEIDSTERF